jgi:hypothetical protein
MASTQAASPRLLVAASGTGGHLFPAIATAQELLKDGYTIEWLGVPDRLETTLVPEHFPLHTVRMAGFQGRLGLGTIKTLAKFGQATLQVRRLLKQGQLRRRIHHWWLHCRSGDSGGAIAGLARCAARVQCITRQSHSLAQPPLHPRGAGV